MSDADDELARVERACRELADASKEVTFPAVAAAAGLGRATLYRRAELRAVVEEHRAHARDARTLSGLATQITQLRAALEAVAANVARHEEELRRLRRSRR